METRKVVIIGSGPAGYGAAVYNARAYLEPLLFAGPEPGGQLTRTTDVENYPGYADGILGPELMREMKEQAEKFGAEIRYETVSQVDFSSRPFRIMTESGEYYAESIVLAMGARSKMLGIGEEKFLGRGVSTCAVCDAAFFKDKVTYIVGGGDTAVEDSFALAKHASEVHMLVRSDRLKASEIMQKRLREHAKVRVYYNSEVVEVMGNERLERIVIDSKGKSKEVLVGGLFLAIGHIPSTGFLQGSMVKLDARGFIVTRLGYSELGLQEGSEHIQEGLVRYPTMTSVEGVFAGGDVVDFRYKQAVSAAGLGVMAALDAEWWLGENNI